MRHRLLLSLATIALLGSGCSRPPETVVAGTDATAATVVESTVPGQRPDTEPSTTGRPDNEKTQAAPEDAVAEPYQPNDTTSTVAPSIDQNPDSTDSPDDAPVPSWQDRPLARVVLTGDDLTALGLDSGWTVDQIGFNDIENPYESEETVCGTPVPAQTSYFEASFENREMGTELELSVMPATNGSSIASDFLTVMGLLATCPDLEGGLANIAVEVVAIDVEGANRSIVITGIDASSPAEPIGVTLAAAVVDGHLFLTIVVQDTGVPASDDVALAISTLELSISRL